ncbi:sensor histidine kinase [Miltoncostaea marina]|uniref:sensor histidine kinase n=1 Tax=Miltoncostaea marina TaxID=2843215 RepID=UPI001C3D1B13|nr:HAMP domain-containing sensor histidine kinase [Miltoncostaea marina]
MPATTVHGFASPAPDAMARVVHDLHGPLTVIRGLCATLARDEARRDRRRAIELIDAEALRLADGLRAIARMEPAPRRPLPACDLGALVDEAAERFAGAAALRGIAVRVRAAVRPVSAAADRGDVERILDNLLANAVRHGREGGVITLALAVRGRRAEVRVRDDGDGVPPAYRERVFLPGERGSAPAGEGRGLGLAIARELAEAGGGRLTLDPVGAGACFRLALPLAPRGHDGPRAA